jgi:dTDP-4-dehydrorhamnose 3,5-epimerase
MLDATSKSQSAATGAYNKHCLVFPTSMIKKATNVIDAWLLLPNVRHDARGFFLESWNRETFRRIGIDADFVQDNHSRSAKHVLRGLHYQKGSAAQGKLVWVTSGTVFDVIVDLRRSSATFGMWDGYCLTAEAHERLYVPPGCAHGFLVLSDTADFHYKVTTPYAPEAERAVRWSDPDIGIRWPLGNHEQPLLSVKDASAPNFKNCEKYE